MMDVCPVCGRPLVPFRAKLVCLTAGCGFAENCCDGGRMHPGLPPQRDPPPREAPPLPPLPEDTARG